MAKYEVYVEEMSYGFVTIEAENEDEAYEKAQDAYFDGQVNWTGGDFNTKNVKKISD